MKKIFLLTAMVTLSFLMTACLDSDGDNSYNNLRADLVELTTTSATKVPWATTDEDERLTFSSPITVSWAEKADTVYRALLYYNKVINGAPEPVAISYVPVLRPEELKDGDKMYNDPVILESIWTSKNNKYLNLNIGLKTGAMDGLDSSQTLGLVINGVTEHEDGTKTYDLEFYHNQNRVPEYYVSNLYVSIPLNYFNPGDDAKITINTYNGSITKEYTF